MVHPVNQRLKELRIAKGYSAIGFAHFLGIPPEDWIKIENGWPISHQQVMTVIKKNGVTLDWIYHGDERAAGLSQADIKDALDLARSAVAKRGNQMNTKDVSVTDIGGRTVPALLIVCPKCSNSTFQIFAIGKHQHLQCTQCDESFCDGSCSKGAG